MGLRPTTFPYSPSAQREPHPALRGFKTHVCDAKKKEPTDQGVLSGIREAGNRRKCPEKWPERFTISTGSRDRNACQEHGGSESRQDIGPNQC